MDLLINEVLKIKIIIIYLNSKKQLRPSYNLAGVIYFAPAHSKFLTCYAIGQVFRRGQKFCLTPGEVEGWGLVERLPEFLWRIVMK
jgi:hypothetical protein